MEDWISLPRMAREIGIPNSTARRWAAALDELLSSHGRGAGRRFHLDGREILRRAKMLYGTGLGADQILEILRADAPCSAGEAGAESEAGHPTGSATAGDIPTLAPRPVESAAANAVGHAPARPPASGLDFDRVLRGIAALEQVIAKMAADQRRENARFRSVLGALVDLIEVQDQNRRLGMAEKDKRDTQAQQRVMMALRELLRVRHEEEADEPEDSSSGAGARSRKGRRRFR